MNRLFFVFLGACCLFFQTSHADQVQLYAFTDEPVESHFDPECILCTDSEDYVGTIAFTKHWKIVYWKNQSYLGRSLIISKRHFGSYEEMTDEEALEYRDILKQYLPAVQKAFGVTHFNVAYLMNMAYRQEKADPLWKEGKPNPHFHWHVIPRYDSERVFAGQTFSDPDFGNPFDMDRKQYLEGEFRENAISSIRKNLNIVYLSDYDSNR